MARRTCECKHEIKKRRAQFSLRENRWQNLLTVRYFVTRLCFTQSQARLFKVIIDGLEWSLRWSARTLRGKRIVGRVCATSGRRYTFRRHLWRCINIAIVSEDKDARSVLGNIEYMLPSRITTHGYEWMPFYKWVVNRQDGSKSVAFFLFSRRPLLMS